MKKVMFLCCNFTWGGIEQYILNVIDNIDREKYNISVLLIDDKKYDNEKALIERNVQIYKLAGRKRKDFKNLINKENIDIVHITLGYSAYLYARTALKTDAQKVIIHSHTTMSGRTSISTKAKIARKMMYIYANKFICKKTINLACSELAGDYLFNKKQNVEIVYNGIEINKFINEKKEDYIFDKYGIDRQKINILHIGRIETQKNPLFLIKILSELVKIDENYNLIYIGSGTLKSDVDDLIKKMNLGSYVKYIPYTNEISKIMKCSDCFLLPSLYEGLGIVLIEAQAAGLMCFTSEKVVPEIADCGLCKFIGLDKDEKTWAELIDVGINNSNLKCDYEMINKFSIQTTVKRLEEIYG